MGPSRLGSCLASRPLSFGTTWAGRRLERIPRNRPRASEHPAALRMTEDVVDFGDEDAAPDPGLPDKPAAATVVEFTESRTRSRSRSPRSTRSLSRSRAEADSALGEAEDGAPVVGQLLSVARDVEVGPEGEEEGKEPAGSTSTAVATAVPSEEALRKLSIKELKRKLFENSIRLDVGITEKA